MSLNSKIEAVTVDEYNKCARAYADCYQRLAETNKALEDTNKILNEYKLQDENASFKDFLQGAGVGAGAAAVIIIVIEVLCD